MELVLAPRTGKAQAATSDLPHPDRARPEYLLKIGTRLVPVTRASLERLGIVVRDSRG